jgi:hypothetical protein
MPNDSNSALTIARAGALVFGDKWIIKHGEVLSGEWNNVLLAFTDQQIATGIKRMTKDAEHKIKAGDEAWPPTAFEFACYCKTPNSLYFHSPMLLENKTVSTPEQAKKHIAEIRRKLNLGRTDELPDETFPKDSSDAISA